MSWRPTRAVCGQNILAGASAFWEPDGEAGRVMADKPGKG